MFQVVARVRRVGGSLMITLPKEAADAEGIREDSVVTVRVAKRRRDSFGALRGIGPWEHDEGEHD